MTWEYSGDPAFSSKDEVRFLIGDTDDSDHQLEDEEIDYLVTTYGDATVAALAGARALASKYSRLSISAKAVGDLKIDYRSKAAEYRELVKTLKDASGSGSTVRPIPQATGITISGVETARENEDRVQEEFAVGMDDIPGYFPPLDTGEFQTR